MSRRIKGKQPGQPTTARNRITSSVIRTSYGLVLSALSKEATIHCVSPVYGSAVEINTLPWQLIILPLILIWLVRPSSLQGLYSNAFANVISVLGCAVSTVAAFTLRLGPLGPTDGAIVTTFIPQLMLVLSTFRLAALGLLGEGKDMRLTRRESWPLFLYVVLSYILYSVTLEPLIRAILYKYFLTALNYVGRYGLQAILACLFTNLACSKLALLFNIPLLLMAISNPHIPLLRSNTDILNNNIAKTGYRIVDRQESVTGYLAVIDNLKDQFRVLRCDHSLLGGEWTKYPPGIDPKLKEPIYSIFVTLEAVRLVQTERTLEAPIKAAKDQQALIIGLGIGTSPAAFIHHGIPTTILEIDPVVHRFAAQYFSLPSNHTAVIGDAIDFVASSQSTQRDRYNFIIHDVFTGGTEPLELFTQIFLIQLRNLLAEDGTIAINYAGDLLLPTALSVVKTALSVFPICRIFRETAAAENQGEQTTDLTNMVLFCRRDPSPFTFREPTEEDFLGSHARREHLMPRHEIDIARFLEKGEDGGEGKGAGQGVVIKGKEELGKLKKSQKRNARNHWELMRGVLPREVWVNW
ncbi:uncharacterized protein KY384_000508 [Bacidia gigantensis]|uniref:uncharacterized protein n=1 Tax=Bacidia gigantensis TaxID=2732470 RepID=UPI001D047033|nr:uncharacterized protein KY384_000508 [Bacidia gigantensis]KAG8525748.1 hypothetical protein KY384_000508 [Bacidia gigantensis]